MSVNFSRHVLPLFVAVGLAVVWLKPLDALAERHVESGLQRAAITFAAARGLNALLSLAQSAAVSGGVFVEASANPGALLEPIDDMVEQFSALMLFATLSFGVQRVLLEASASWPVTLLLSFALVAWSVRRWQISQRSQWLWRIVLVLAVLRLAVPVFAIASEGTYQWLLKERYEQPQTTIEKAASNGDSTRAGGLVEELRRRWKEGGVEGLKARMEGVVGHLTTLATVFVVQVVLLPLALLWLLGALLRRCATLPGEPVVSLRSLRTSTARNE
jgi:hypothetical protein